ncbi:hypothetical protein Q7C36_016375 [Tachysurus vachellii]|uniref:Uncharacterized protein n=1 Tax=Tachysurus vachellii TaxID=175792 RepID=A0AA88M5Z3_TACVA|nr:hypothetical protein Q7C36_016375 [Tachysurus vachellii]
MCQSGAGCTLSLPEHSAAKLNRVNYSRVLAVSTNTPEAQKLNELIEWSAERDVTDGWDNEGQKEECGGSSGGETPQQDSGVFSRFLGGLGWQAFPCILTDCFNTIASHGFEN